MHTVLTGFRKNKPHNKHQLQKEDKSSIYRGRTTTKTLLMLTILSVMLPANADPLAELIELKSKNAVSDKSSSQAFHISYKMAPNIKVRHIDTLYASEQSGSQSAIKVLQMVRKMALDHKKIIKGSCWDYLNAAFIKAGVGRKTVFKGAYPKGPFVQPSKIKAGDWLYYVNHSYNDIQHSGLFVGWIDKAKNKALILSYAGGNRNEPARYKVYDISHTYNIMRPTL